MSVKSTTANLGLTKFSRGHSVLDTDLGINADLIDAAYQSGVKVAKGVLVAGLADAIAFAWQNPESTEVLVQRVIVDVTTAGGTVSSVLDVGVTDTASASAADIMDNADLNSTGVTDHSLVAGAGLGGVHKLGESGGTNDYVTGTIRTANASALVGKYYIEYIVV